MRMKSLHQIYPNISIHTSTLGIAMSRMEHVPIVVAIIAITLVHSPGYAIGAKILIAYPATNIFFQSHIRFQSVLSRELVKRGHHVVVLSNSIIRNRGGNSEETYSEMITFKLPHDEAIFMQRHHDFFDMVSDPRVRLKDIFAFSDTVLADCKYLWNDTDALGRLRKENFDLILMNPFGQCEYLLHCYLGVPFVVFTPAMRYPTFNEDTFRVPSPMSYVPGLMTGFSNDMSLYQRTMNAISRTIVSSMISHFMISSYDKIKEDQGLCPGVSLLELNRKAELWLVNADVVADFPHPSTPNVISIGGLMTEPANPLTKDLKMFVEDTEMKGVIVVSMGSSITLKEKEAFLYINALSRLPYQVVFRHKGNITNKVNKNIKIVQWMPQNDLLGHHSTKLFIGHGGINGVYEALYHAIPMVLIPHGLDQNDNAVRVYNKGVGVCLNSHDLDENKLYDAVVQVLGQKKYKEAAVRWANIHKDQPLTPREKAVFWIEHIIKYGGAHLRPRGADMDFIQYYNLDVAVLIVSFIAIVAVIGIICCTKCYKVCQKYAKLKQS